MRKPVFTGVCTALVTPFIHNQVNYPLLEQLIRYQTDAGVDAIVLSGTTGESPTLSDEEKITMIEKAKVYAANSCTIIAGTGSNSTEHAITISVKAEQAGADALLVVAPYYNKGNEEGLYQHFCAIAKAVHIPVILYNVPTRTGVDIPISVYKRLSAIPNIAGVKEATSDITKIVRIRNQCPADFYIWSGNDDQIVPVIASGGQGVISVLSNLFPEDTVMLTQAALAGDFDTAAALQAEFLPVIEFLFSEVNPIPVKYAMKYIGFDCGPCRLPLGPIGKALQKRIDQFFN